MLHITGDDLVFGATLFPHRQPHCDSTRECYCRWCDYKIGSYRCRLWQLRAGHVQYFEWKWGWLVILCNWLTECKYISGWSGKRSCVNFCPYQCVSALMYQPELLWWCPNCRGIRQKLCVNILLHDVKYNYNPVVKSAELLEHYIQLNTRQNPINLLHPHSLTCS